VTRADTDIAIVGGGPVGAALALALRGAGNGGHRVTVLEGRGHVAAGAGDPRPIALSHGSRLLLERLGVWDALRASGGTAINHIHVSQRGGFGRLAMNAADAGVPNLGYVYDYNNIFMVLAGAAHGAGCDYREGARANAVHRDGELQRIGYTHNGAAATLTAQLVVVADGGDIDCDGLPPPKIIDYAQHALTARVSTSRPHMNAAYERFTPEGPLALLPFSDETALVWALTPARAAALKDADAKTFLAALRESFGGRLGDFTAVRQRACFPLTLRRAAATRTPGMVTIGNAAQTLHPVAGQGFNLGLRDAWELAQRLRVVTPQALTGKECLRGYSAGRRLDRVAAIAATHGLVRLFSNDFFPANVARGAGMTLLGCVAPLKNFVARRMIFGVRG
jgi:2-octaprenyl-6-methoxyphenol hydroxylase